MKPVQNIIFTAAWRLILLIGLLLPEEILAQCGVLTKYGTYDTVLTGNGNDYHSVKVPQFNPAKGTLVAVVIKSAISLKYSFGLENNASTASSYTVGVGRNDYIGGNVMQNPALGGVEEYYGPYSLAASNGVSGSGGDYVSQNQLQVLEQYIDINDSITGAVAGFLGNGYVNLDYYPTTYYEVSGNYNFQFTASDSIYFSLSYYYCNTFVLPLDINNFTAVAESDTAVKLTWASLNEQTGNLYDIEKSTDGINFNIVGSVNADKSSDGTGRYAFNYPVTAKIQGKLFFRLKIIQMTGEIKYSDIEWVDFGNTADDGFYLYPNPSNSFINIRFKEPVNKNWQVTIFSAVGDLIQSDIYVNTTSAHIIFRKKLAAGIYFMRASHQQEPAHYLSSFVVQ